MFRKKSRFERAHKRLKKRWFLDRRSRSQRISDAINEFIKPRR
jgi:hypothetical protein